MYCIDRRWNVRLKVVYDSSNSVTKKLDLLRVHFRICENRPFSLVFVVLSWYRKLYRVTLRLFSVVVDRRISIGGSWASKNKSPTHHGWFRVVSFLLHSHMAYVHFVLPSVFYPYVATRKLTGRRAFSCRESESRCSVFCTPSSCFWRRWHELFMRSERRTHHFHNFGLSVARHRIRGTDEIYQIIGPTALYEAKKWNQSTLPCLGCWKNTL